VSIKVSPSKDITHVYYVMLLPASFWRGKKSPHNICHAGTESESGYSPSQALTMELDGRWMFKAMPQLYPWESWGQ